MTDLKKPLLEVLIATYNRPDRVLNAIHSCLNIKDDRIISVEKIDVKMRLRQFFKTSDKIYVSTDGYGIFELSFKKIIP